MRLLLSMCNLGVFNSQFSLAAIEARERGQIDLIDCRSFMNPTKDAGINGLIAIPGGLAVAIQSSKPRVSLLDTALQVTQIVEHPFLQDLHSLHFEGGRLFCVCTGNNKILEIDPDTGEVSVFWEYHIDQPHLHINAFTFHGSRALVSSHSMPIESGVRVRGGAWYLDNFEPALTGLEQPHSLHVAGDTITCLSSHDSRVVVRNGEDTSERNVRGYLRGMHIDGDQVFLGSSSKRFMSRKQKQMQAFVDFDDVVGNKDFMSSIVVCDSSFKPQMRINLTHVGFEIYDVIADPGLPDEVRGRPAMALRMQTMFRQNVFFREQLQAANKRAREAEVG